MTTKIDVVNEALMLLEQPETASLESNDSWVRRIGNRYPATARRLFEQHPWNFCTQREALTQLVETPLGRDFAYNKPGDCLRINMINDTGSADDEEEPNYEDEGGKILADMDPCYMFFISSRWLTLEGSWPQAFAFAVSAELASLCQPVTSKSRGKKEDSERKAKIALQKAKSWDASQKPYRRLPMGRWVRARRGNRFSRLTGNG